MIEVSAFISLDVHKETVSVAIAEAGRTGRSVTSGTFRTHPKPSQSWRDGWADSTAPSNSSTKPAPAGIPSRGSFPDLVLSAASAPRQ